MANDQEKGVENSSNQAPTGLPEGYLPTNSRPITKSLDPDAVEKRASGSVKRKD